MIKVKHLKDYFKHKKKEKKEEGLRVRCGIDATRIEYVKIPPKYETICWKKRERRARSSTNWVSDVLERACGTNDVSQLASRLWRCLIETSCTAVKDERRFFSHHHTMIHQTINVP